MRRDPVLHRARRLDIVAARGLAKFLTRPERGPYPVAQRLGQGIPMRSAPPCRGRNLSVATGPVTVMPMRPGVGRDSVPDMLRSEEHTSELQSLMRISYAVFCLKKKKKTNNKQKANNDRH